MDDVRRDNDKEYVYVDDEEDEYGNREFEPYNIKNVYL